MTPSFAYFRSLLMAAVLASAVSACASLPPPTAELAAAQQAVAAASDADAEQYAAQDLANAREALRRAQVAMTDGRNEDARRFALAADADAGLARARSEEASLTAQVARYRDEIEQLQQRLGEGER